MFFTARTGLVAASDPEAIRPADETTETFMAASLSRFKPKWGGEMPPPRWCRVFPISALAVADFHFVLLRIPHRRILDEVANELGIVCSHPVVRDLELVAVP